MQTDSKNLISDLKGIRSEILALKQTYQRGLNRTNFELRYIQEQMSQSVVNFRLQIVYDEKTKQQPFVEISIYHFYYANIRFSSWTWDENTHTTTITGKYHNYRFNNNNKTELALISSAPIKSLTWSEN